MPTYVPAVPPAPAAITVAAADPAAATAGTTPWDGWELVRPGGLARGYGSPLIGAAGDIVAVSDRDDVLVAEGARTVSAGRVPGADPTGLPHAPVVLPSGRLVVADGRGVSISDDRGARWRRRPLPAVGDGTRVGPVRAPGGRLLIVVGTPSVPAGTAFAPPATRTGPAVLASDDDGDTWNVVRPAEGTKAAALARTGASRGTARDAPSGGTSRKVHVAHRPATPRATDPGPPPVSRVAVSRVVARPDGGWLRVVTIAADAQGPSGVVTRLERSDDGGGTWTTVDVPGVPTRNPFVDESARAAAVGTPGTLAGGAVVVPVGDGLAVSDDDLRTFRRVVPPGADPRVLCDPVGACLVDVLDPERPGQRFAVPFDGHVFGDRRPHLPDQVVASAGGVLIGVGPGPVSGTTIGPPGGPAVVRSEDGGRSWAADPRIPGGVAAIPTTGAGTLRARTAAGRLELTRDGVAWTVVPLPGIDPLVAVAGTSRSPVALDLRGRVHEWADGRWSSWSAAAVGPRAVAVAGDLTVVAGRDGVLVRTASGVRRTLRIADGRVRGVRGTALVLGRGFGGVAARGRTLFAWGVEDGRTPPDDPAEGGVVRSGDGGRTWRRVRGPRYADDVQLLDGGVVLLGSRARLWRSSDGGRRFSVRARVPASTGSVPARVGFVDARRGVVRGSATDDGGRTFVRLPVPPGGTDVLGLGDGGDLVASGPLGAILRVPGVLAAGGRPRIVASAEGGRPRTRRTPIAVSGRATNLPVGTEIAFEVAASSAARARESTARVAVVAVDGTFHGAVGPRTRDERVWRARTVETPRVRIARTVLGVGSGWVGVPR